MPLQKELLQKYVDAVMHAPASLGLTATEDPREFWERHVLDALKLVELLPLSFQKNTIKVLDVGAGNGIPGIPAAIAMPQWDVTLLESNSKKSGFLDMFCKYNKLDNVRVRVGRAETEGHLPQYREKFDLVLARALAKLPSALELTIPFVKPGGSLLIPHGPSFQEELDASHNALHELSASLEEARPYKINERVEFTALLFKKDHETPARYPRKVGDPKKHPL